MELPIRVNVDSIEGATARHFAGTCTRMVVEFVRDCVSPAALTATLTRAGETRSLAELCDDTNWSSYDRFRRLLEAAAVTVGGPRELIRVGTDGRINSAESTADFTDMLQALGSPSALYATIPEAAHAMTALNEVTSEEIGPNEWLISQRFHHGYAPFEEYCWYSAAMFALLPRMFGYPPADVVEERCQLDGADKCVYRVRWEQIHDPHRRAEYFEMRTRLLEGRLTALQRTVAELVSGETLEDVLSHIVASAAKAVPAPSYVLALDPMPGARRRVHAVGLDDGVASRVAEEIGHGDTDRPDRLVVEVSSERRTYGRLAAFNSDGHAFMPQERGILEAYARLAAAALDSAGALEEARRQAGTANALLELADALAEIASTDEMAARLARAVPAVVDCDRSVVILVDDTTGTGNLAAAHGYTTESEVYLRSALSGLPVSDLMEAISHFDRSSTFAGVEVGSVMANTGSVAAAGVPIMSNGELIGYVLAVVTKDADRLRSDPTVTERLRGLAAHAATAMRNARLLDQIRHQALHDTLTGLPNRALILDRAEHMLARARREHTPVAALFVDLDNFKTINDTMGHEVGDQLLQAVAARLGGVVRDSDTVGRLGGDEFVVLAEGVSLAAGPELVAERLHDVLREPFRLPTLEDTPLSVSASIGIAGGDRTAASELLRDADIALYRAKSDGRNCSAVFAPEMQSEVLRRLELEMDLRCALANGEFFLVYQPVFDLSGVHVSGVEALLRWQHPTRGVVGPDDFVPMLEETKLILEVGRWVLFEACHQTARWHASGRGLAVSVNVSMRQLESDQLLTDVSDALRSSGLDSASLVLEVTETSLMIDAQATVRRLSMLKELGVRIAIDDFGTGYSSLAYLRQFPVDALKIDRSFIAAMRDSAESTALIHTLVQLGRALGLETLAEGIEENGQLHQLQAEQCDSGQGFLFSRPLEVGAIEAFLDRYETAPVTARS